MFISYFNIVPQINETGISLNPRRKRLRSKDDIIKRNLSKYPLLPPCSTSCKLNCKSKLAEEKRSEIRHAFRSLEFEGRRQWLNEHVSLIDVKRKKSSTANPDKRNRTLLYTLPSTNNELTHVCKVMFLATLGARSDGIVMEFVNAKAKPQHCGIFITKDRRGRKKKDENPVHEKIIEHINSYHPAVSHYNREKAPNRRYLEGH